MGVVNIGGEKWLMIRLTILRFRDELLYSVLNGSFSFCTSHETYAILIIKKNPQQIKENSKITLFPTANK